MARAPWCRRAPSLGLLLLAGCCYPLCRDPDTVVCEFAQRPLDVRPAAADPPMPPAVSRDEADIVPAAGQGPPAQERLRVPPEVPGAEAPPIALPADRAERDKAIDRLFPKLPPLGGNPQPGPGPEGRPLELADLQRLAMSNNPALKQAAADVAAARGAAQQAGLYPNPNVGFEADTTGQGGTAGIIGGYVEQQIKTAGKLKLARAAAEMEVRAAELALEKAKAEALTQVRAGYFAVLNAQERMKISLAFTYFTEELYRIQVEQLRQGLVAPYEPLQFRTLAVQARAQLVQARNRYVSAWKQLAAALGLPGLPPAQLAGRIDMPIPVYHHDELLARVLSRHSDVLTADALLQRARYQLRLAQVTPVPDVDTRVMVQRDHTTPPFGTVTSVVVGIPVPVFDRNQGNIRQAEANLVRASEEAHRVRAELTGKVADAFERYDNSRQLIGFYRRQMLPDQVQVFRRVWERYHLEPDKVNFNDVSTAQQNIAATLTLYLEALREQWNAVVDLANLLQTEDLFQVGTEPVRTECLPPLPDLGTLLPLPCQHPCSPLSDPALRGADGRWPPALPSAAEKLPSPRTLPQQ